MLFGIDKLRAPTNWVVYIPNELGQWIQKSGHISVIQFLWVQGVIEVILGLQFFLGCLTRLSAVGCSAFLIGIIYVIGLDPIGIRDLGLLSCAIALVFLGPGDWSLDARLNLVSDATSRQADALPGSQKEV